MSAPLMPELPEANGFRPDSAFTADQLRAYGLAVWKAAIEAAAQEADNFAEMMESGAGNVKPGYRLRQLARTLRSLPLPESDMMPETK